MSQINNHQELLEMCDRLDCPSTQAEFEAQARSLLPLEMKLSPKARKLLRRKDGKPHR